MLIIFNNIFVIINSIINLNNNNNDIKYMNINKKSAAWLWRPGRYMISKLYPKSLVAHFCCSGMW